VNNVLPTTVFGIASGIFTQVVQRPGRPARWRRKVLADPISDSTCDTDSGLLPWFWFLSQNGETG